MVRDNPKTLPFTLIFSRSVMVFCRVVVNKTHQGESDANTYVFAQPDVMGAGCVCYLGLNDSSMDLTYVTRQMEGNGGVCWHSMAACGALRAAGTAAKLGVRSQ